MLVQWCLKGLQLPDDAAAEHILDSQSGLLCNWWRAVSRISPAETRAKLTFSAADMHVNHFEDIDPATHAPFSISSPFISLSAGTVERNAALQTNVVRRAIQTALWFGTEFGARNVAYIFRCWVVLAPRQAVEIEAMAEEVRDLNTYRRYSEYQPEGEILAKIAIPDNQIAGWEKWEIANRGHGGALSRTRFVSNPRFTPPEQLSNVKELI